MSDNPYEGTYHVAMKQYPSMDTSVSTSGYTNIHLKFAGYTWGFDAGEYMTAEWYDGSDWYIADQFTSGSWSARDIALPSGAANNPNFKIRISTNSNKNTEWGYVDAVEVTGTP